MWSILSKVLGINYTKGVLLKKLISELESFLAGQLKIKFRKTKSPLISVIIPVYNGAHHTLKCLLALSQDESADIEVIVFDDGSSDATSLLLERCENLIVLKNEKNAGSINAINTATQKAKGKYILLLNNDATIVSGNIADAVSTFQREKNVGALGGRIVQADGRLQEAGCIIFQDGVTNGYLRFAVAEDPRAMFMRDVDYCSAMYLLLERQQFLSCGGLDTIYAPAYFEETDLCMKLREKGLRVIYDPTILVEHFEFGSHQSKSGRALIEERRPIFLGRWQKHLQQEGYSLTERAKPELTSATRLITRPRLLLVIDKTLPQDFSDLVRDAINCALKCEIQVALLVPKIDKYPWSSFHTLFDKKIEVIFSSRTYDLASLLKQRPHYFDFCAAIGEVSEKSIRAFQLKKGKSAVTTEFYPGLPEQLIAYIAEARMEKLRPI